MLSYDPEPACTELVEGRGIRLTRATRFCFARTASHLSDTSP